MAKHSARRARQRQLKAEKFIRDPHRSGPYLVGGVKSWQDFSDYQPGESGVSFWEHQDAKRNYSLTVFKKIAGHLSHYESKKFYKRKYSKLRRSFDRKFLYHGVRGDLESANLLEPASDWFKGTIDWDVLAY